MTEHSSSYLRVLMASHHTHSPNTGNASNSQSTYPPNIESNTHPLYLHNNDQPGMILISKKLIGSENFASWKRSMKTALSAKNKLGVVTGTFTSPPSTSPLFAQWQRVNDMVITWILNTVSDEISNSMNYLDNAQTVWHELNERFDAVNDHKIYEVQRELFKLEQGTDSVEFYFHKLKGFWEELKALQPAVLCTCNATKAWDEQAEKAKLVQFLMGLHPSFTAARGNLLMMNPWPNLNQAFLLLKQEEKQRQVQSSATPIAMMVNIPKQPQSLNTNKSGDQTGDKASLECSYCHSKGHLKEKCYKLVGYPSDHPYHPNNKGKKKVGNRFQQSLHQSSKSSPQVMQVSDIQTSQLPDTSPPDLVNKMESLQQQMQTLMQCFQKGSSVPSGTSTTNPFGFSQNIAGTAISLLSNVILPTNVWILDTGATSHMCCNPGLMHDIKPLTDSLSVKFPDGNTALVTHSGSVFLTPLSLVITNVLLIPSFHFNLISIGSLSSQIHSKIFFTATQCLVQDPVQMKELVLGNFIDGLYQLVSAPTPLPVLSAISPTSMTIWHKRLGHVPPSVISKISSLHTSNSTCSDHCTICPLAKQCRFPFNTSQSRADSPFDIVHCDVWGPYKIPTCDGCKYFVTLLDDNTRALWTVFIPTKQHAVQTFKDFYAHVYKRFGTSIKCLRTDNGGEFVNNELATFLASHGVSHQTTCPYTPQQNGRVERRHRNLLEMTRAFLFQSQLPSHLWGECLLTSTYIINRIPTTILNNISPYEALYHTPPSYDNIRVFGCLAYMSVHQSDKLAARAVPTVFIGYPLLQKGLLQ